MIAENGAEGAAFLSEDAFSPSRQLFARESREAFSRSRREAWTLSRRPQGAFVTGAQAQPPGRGLARTTAARGEAARLRSRERRRPRQSRAARCRAPVFVVRKTGRIASATADFSVARCAAESRQRFEGKAAKRRRRRAPAPARIPCFPWQKTRENRSVRRQNQWFSKNRDKPLQFFARLSPSVW